MEPLRPKQQPDYRYRLDRRAGDDLRLFRRSITLQRRTTACPRARRSRTILANSVGDFTTLIGGSNTALTGSAKTGWGGAIGNFATLWGALPNQSGGAPSTADLASICTKQTDIQTYALTHNIKVNSLYRLNDPEIWGDSSNATITGYITNSDGSHATLNVLSTPYGSLALAIGTETAKLTSVGLPVASPVTIPLTTTATSAYAITPNTTAVLGSIGSPVTFAVGAFAPRVAYPVEHGQGLYQPCGGVSTLHVTSLDDGVSHSGLVTFTGTLGTNLTGRIDDGGTRRVNHQRVLTVTSPYERRRPTLHPASEHRSAHPSGHPERFTCANVTALTGPALVVKRNLHARWIGAGMSLANSCLEAARYQDR